METQEPSAIDWDTLCLNIAKKNVIPILGNEMYSCNINGEASNIEKWFADQLQQRFNTNEPSLNTLTSTAEYLVNERNIKIRNIRIFLQTLSCKDASFPLLQTFLSIDQLLFYINTTTYGDIFKRALNSARDTETEQQNFTIDEHFNGCDISELKNPFLLNIFGSLENSLMPGFLEEEMLECVNQFIEKKLNEPLNKILGALGSKTLLFLGCSQPGWLMRFLFRNLSNKRMASWDDRGGDIIVVNDKTPERDVLFSFLEKNNAITYERNTADFVRELAAGWQSFIKRNPPKPKEIFISYSHKDFEQARCLHQKLKAINNVKCWFDEERVQAGDNFQFGITTGINSADLFMPLLSKNSVGSNAEALVNVKGEWREAWHTYCLRKQKNGGKDLNYLMPVVIDDVSKSDPVIQDFFPKLSIADMPGGNADEAFISQVKQQLNIV